MKRKEPEEILENLDNDLSVDDIDLDEDFALDESDDEEEAAPKAKKPRTPRKRKQPTLTMTTTPVEAPKEPKRKITKIVEAIDEEKTEVIEVKPAPKAEAKKTVLKTSEAPVAVEFPKVEKVAPVKTEAVPLDSTSVPAPLVNGEPMVKEWGAVRDVSVSVSENLQQVAQQLKELQTNYQTAIQDARKQSNVKPALLARIAIGASAIALVFSFVSITLSQSARQAVLSNNVFPKEPAFETRAPREPKTPKFEAKVEPKAPLEKHLAKKEAPIEKPEKAIDKKPADKRLSAALLREKAIAALSKEKSAPKKKSLAKGEPRATKKTL